MLLHKLKAWILLWITIIITVIWKYSTFFFNKKGLALEVEIILFINIVFFLNY